MAQMTNIVSCFLMFHYMGPADLDICGVPMVESDAERGASAPGAAVVVILGVCILWLEKLDPVRGSGRNKSRCRPSRMCISVLRELVAVEDCLKNRIVFCKSSCKRSASTWR